MWGTASGGKQISENKWNRAFRERKDGKLLKTWENTELQQQK